MNVVMSIQSEFLKRVEKFIRDKKMTPTRFGLEAASDAAFVFDLREGRCPRSDTIDRIDTWMNRRRPRKAA